MKQYRTYQEYLRHPKFLAVRSFVFARSEGQCEQYNGDQRCTAKALDVHHIQYCKWGEFDPPENLVAVCRECHEALHTCQKCGGRLRSDAIKQNRKTCAICTNASLGLLTEAVQ